MNNCARLWANYNTILHPDEVEQLLVRPLLFLKEDPTHLVPSIQVSAAGLRVSSIFIVTPRFVCELDLSAQCRFDFGLREAKYIRIELNDPAPPAEQCSATVEIIHHGSAHSNIYFVGTSKDRDVWLELVRNAFPLDSTLT